MTSYSRYPFGPPTCDECSFWWRALMDCQAGATRLDDERHELARKHDALIDELQKAHEAIGRMRAGVRVAAVLGGQRTIDPRPIAPARVYVGLFGLAAAMQWIGIAAATGVHLRPSELRYR